MAKLTFYYSTMNAGKSLDLLRAAYSYEEGQNSVQCYTAKIDNRTQEGFISTRVQGIPDRKAELFCPNKDLFEDIAQHGKDVACILVDEANFLTKEHVHQLARVCDELDIPVICYGIRTDFRGELFEGSAALFALANKLQEVVAMCHCGSQATMVVRKSANGKAITDGPQICIGGNDTYQQLCRPHWNAATGLLN